MSWITSTFPKLSAKNHEITSAPDGDYNCIAWAAGDNAKWWTHIPGYRWPARRNPQIEGLVAVFENLGYEDCGMNGSLEPRYEKVALYTRNGLWTHAARQNPDGAWTSKLGPDEDIKHDSANDMIGKLYGKIHCFMRRRIT